MSVNKSLAVEITANSSGYTAALEQAARSTETNARRMRTSLDQVGSASRSNGQMFTQFGYQVNDVAAQVGAGTNVIQAFGQQAGQLLQVFGPFGAILGAAVTVGATFAVTMLDGKDAAEKAEKATKDYGDAVEFARQITETSEETQRRHNEERRQGAIETLKAAKAEKELAAARLQMQISELETLRGYGDFDSAGAGDMSSTYHTAGVELERLKGQLAELQKSAEVTNTSLSNVMNPRAGWQDDFRPEKPAKPEKSARTQSIEEERDAVEEYIQSLRDGVEVQRLMGREAAIFEAVLRAQGLAMKDNKVLTETQIEDVKRLAGASFDLAEAHKKLEENRRRADDESKESLKEQERLVKQLGMSFSSAFEDAIIGGEKFGGVLKSLIADMAKLALRQTVTAPASDLLSKGLGIATSFATSLAGGYFNPSMTPAVRGNYGTVGGVAINGARAAGGPVNANSTYLVGEQGPELLRLGNAPGHVTPNHKLGGLGGGNTTVVNQTIQISTGVSQTVRSELANMLPQIASATKASLANDQMRKGRSL